MGKILYGVMGDSGGHLSRSLAIARQLSGHEIVFVGGGRVSEVASYGFSTVETPMLGTEIAGAHVDILATVGNGVRQMTGRSAVVERLQGVINDFDPDLILTDYEYYLPLAARKLGRSCISINRQHVLTNCHYAPPPGHRFSAGLTKTVIRALHMTSTRYLVCSFMPMTPADPRTSEIYPPVLRPEVEQMSPTEGDHALVYLYGTPLSWIREVLGSRKRRYIIYGQDHAGEEGNLSFRSYSVEQFLIDLAGAAYVISHGGHNLISEALMLGKPLLCYPIGLEYEQYFNAKLLEGAGYGTCGALKSGAVGIDQFEKNLPGALVRARAYHPWSTHSIAGRLEQFLCGQAEPGSHELRS